MAVNDDLADALTSHSIGLQRLSNATVRKIIALLNRSDARIVELLTREDLTELGRRRQEALLRDLRRIVESAYSDATGALQIDLEDLALYEADYQMDLFREVVPVRLEFVRPASDQIIAAVNSRPFQGKLLRDWYAELEQSSFRRLRDTIRMGVVEGRTVDQMVRDVRGTRAQGYRDGVLAVNRRAAEATVRTAVSHTANVARNRVYERNKGLIKGVQISATLDGRTSVRCRAADGAVAINEGYSKSDFGRDTRFLRDIPSFTDKSRPPFHPNCRTSTIPVLKSFADIGVDVEVPKSTRASMDGQVAEDMTYGDWLRKQPVAVQNEVLGEKKAALFRKGGLSLDRFVSRAGDELTLDELRQKERAAWDRAELAS